MFALSEAGGTLTEHGALAGTTFEELCRAELRVDSPAGPWTVRLASLIYDEPAAVAWDDHALLVVKYGFLTYGFEARTGELRWSHRSASPLLSVMASPRLPHVLVQAEIETFALEADGTVAWRVAHSDVVIARGAGRRAPGADELHRSRHGPRSGHGPPRALTRLAVGHAVGKRRG